MRPIARTLALRDTALAMALGVMGRQDQPADFGGTGPKSGAKRAVFGGTFGSPFGADTDLATAAAAPAAIAQAGSPFHPANRDKVMSIWNQAHAQQAITSSREALLEPNANSATKVQRYIFSVGQQALVLGTAAAIQMSNQPSVNFRPERLVCNVAWPGFVTLSTVQVANVNAMVGAGDDAWNYSPNAQGITVSLPTLSPSNKATVTGAYTGFIPSGYTSGFSFPFTASFTGWATIVA